MLDWCLQFSSNNPYLSCVSDVESIVKLPKDRSKRANSNNPNTVPLTTLEAFKDAYGATPLNNVDPVVAFAVEMFEIKKSDRKSRGNMQNYLFHCTIKCECRR